MGHHRSAEPRRIRGAWQGRVSGCMLGKPLEVLSFQEGRAGLTRYLERARALPLRDYVGLIEGTVVERTGKLCCAGLMQRAEPDDDINYTVLALMLLEQHGKTLTTEDVARAWLNHLPAGATWTAERAAYRVLLNRMDDEFVNGAAPGFDLTECADNPCNEWIGAQIRTDLYGWVLPGRPDLAADLARRDAALSHRNDGVHGAVFIAALGAAIPATAAIDEAIGVATQYIPSDCGAARAISLALELSGNDDFVEQLHREYGELSPVHTLNNLAVVTWALCTYADDFGAAIGSTVMAGWDTDSNGATVGGLMGLAGAAIPEHWTTPWQGRIGLGIAGVSEASLDDMVTRTLAVARKLQGAS